MKSETITIKCTPEEKAMIKELAYKKDTTVSRLLHTLVFNIALKKEQTIEENKYENIIVTVHKEE